MTQDHLLRPKTLPGIPGNKTGILLIDRATARVTSISESLAKRILAEVEQDSSWINEFLLRFEQNLPEFIDNLQNLNEFIEEAKQHTASSLHKYIEIALRGYYLRLTAIHLAFRAREIGVVDKLQTNLRIQIQKILRACQLENNNRDFIKRTEKAYTVREDLDSILSEAEVDLELEKAEHKQKLSTLEIKQLKHQKSSIEYIKSILTIKEKGFMQLRRSNLITAQDEKNIKLLSIYDLVTVFELLGWSSKSESLQFEPDIKVEGILENVSLKAKIRQAYLQNKISEAAFKLLSEKSLSIYEADKAQRDKVKSQYNDCLRTFKRLDRLVEKRKIASVEAQDLKNNPYTLLTEIRLKDFLNNYASSQVEKDKMLKKLKKVLSQKDIQTLNNMSIAEAMAWLNTLNMQQRNDQIIFHKYL